MHPEKECSSCYSGSINGVAALCHSCHKDYSLQVVDSLSVEQIDVRIKNAYEQLAELAREIDLENSRKTDVESEPVQSEEKSKIVGTILESRLRKN